MDILLAIIGLAKLKRSLSLPDIMSNTKYIQNLQHYTDVINLIHSVKKNLWIGTADIKDLYVKQGSGAVPLLEIISNLIKRGISVRLIHAKEPGENFRKDFDKYPVLWKGLERMLCPRVHSRPGRAATLQCPGCLERCHSRFAAGDQ